MNRAKINNLKLGRLKNNLKTQFIEIFNAVQNLK